MSPFYKGLHHALTSLYGDSFNLSSDNKIFEKVSAVFESVTKWLHRKKDFQPEMLTEKEPQTLINETFNVLKTPLENLSIEQDIPEELTRALEENIFHFSGFKTYHELKEASLLLKDEKGGFKSFDKFAQDVKRINERYNRNYLNAEYEFAVSSSQMAVKWKDYEKDGDRYNLQYRTAADDRVREEHAALHGITLPPSDKFWDKYYPPNGWRCRCTVVQVRKGKYDESDSDDACKAGDKATTHIGKNGSNKAAIFRFNPGKQEKIFPPKHPYYKVPEAVKNIVEKVSAEEMQKKRIAEIITELPNNLTDEQKQAIAEHCIELEKVLGITKGKPMSVDEADKQSANPSHVPKYLLDPQGNLYDGYARYSLNPDYVEKRDKPNSINCQTCAPAYALRLMGFDVSAKPNTKGSKLDYLSKGHAFEVWKNIDGTPAKHTSLNGWKAKKGYDNMTPKRYLEFFEEVCKETGVYELSIGWKGGSGHATILQRFEDGTLKYIEPQHDNSEGSGLEFKDLNYLANNGATSASKIHDCRGIMRIDNKLFNLDFVEIFNKRVDDE